MQTKQLNFNYPSELVATEARARGESRIFLIPRTESDFREISWKDFFGLFKSGDLLVLNDTKVLKARLVMGSKEVFFLRDLGESRWEVLTKGLRGRVGKEFDLPGGLRARFVSVGKPAVIDILGDLDFHSYFEEHGHVPLPPYILALRKSHGDVAEDIERYQTVWAEKMGSVAAPTASLHFNEKHLSQFKKLGIDVKFITLHVGAGTFLPIETENVDDFVIHSERVSISDDVVDAIKKTKSSDGKVWACGTTVMRSLESLKDLKPFTGETNLFIKPGFDFKIVDGLLTNFHQPESSLLLLAASFAGGVDKILKAYELAVDKKFRLFSYGDLTVIV